MTGNLKFDSLQAAAAAASDRGVPRVLRYFRVPDDRPVIVAGSTMKGEELMVLRGVRADARQRARPLLVIAPRHPERFDEVERLARDEGFRTARRSRADHRRASRAADVVVLDTIGELAHLYRLATVVFVGGSLVPTGGHNILEPAVFGKPILFGPHMQNFARDCRRRSSDARAARAGARRAASSSAALRDLLADAASGGRLGRGRARHHRRRAAARASARWPAIAACCRPWTSARRRCARSDVGGLRVRASTAQTMNPSQAPLRRRRPARRSGMPRRPARAPAPASGRSISVGNVAVGGSGKTPTSRRTSRGCCRTRASAPRS